MPKLTLSFKGHLIDVFHLKPGQTLIGRDSDCQVSIDSLAIAPLHAKILLEDDDCRIEMLQENYPIQVNHNPTTSVELRHGDVIQVGKHTLTFSQDAIELAGELTPKSAAQDNDQADATTPDNSNGMLQIMNGENFGRIIPLTRNMTRIGREGSDSAMIAKRDSGYYISYLEGHSSPSVNNQPIGEDSLRLNDGDVIEVGNTQMQFHC
jgi:predicted component of type VI protein secretion system